MLNKAARPPQLQATAMGPELPEHRAADLDEIASLPVRGLFKDIEKEIYKSGQDVTAIRNATIEALADVDMSKIKPDDTVNLLCSEHGFALMGGLPYAEMVKTIKDVVKERTGCLNIRLRYAGGEGISESRHMIPYYGLDKHFDRVVATGPFDKGVAIDTDIGVLYGLKKVYDADWFIHTCYSDPREIYFHREINRILKTFTMAYARYETRSAYHMNFSSRSSNVIPRAIFDSDFVQEKFAFVCVMETSPAGVTGVIANENLYEVDRTVTRNTLKSYGKMIRLFAEIDECVVVLDGMRWPWYIHGGGLVAGTLFKSPLDYLNLDISGRNQDDPHLNPAVKALVVNYAWRNAFIGLVHLYPTFIAGRKTAEGLTRAMLKYGVVKEDLKSALQSACEKADTDKAVVFDGCYGSINLSPSMGEFLLEQASKVADKVDNELLPLWLAQRGLAP